MKNIFFSILILIATISFAQSQNIVHHRINTVINPKTATISVTDSISFVGEAQNEFLLFAGLTPKSLSKGIKLLKTEENTIAKDVGMDRDDADTKSQLLLNKWKIKGKAESLIISYEGIIDGKMTASEENYQRGFAETTGVISETGVYLAGSSYWVATFENTLSTYQLTTSLPQSWRTVSQGKRLSENATQNTHTDTWLCESPQEEIFLIAAEFTEYTHKMNSGINAMAFLRTPDEGLANKYLEVTEQYMEM